MGARRANSSQLRNDIDRGRTSDKVNAGDPAAAPLGTDDEAAGTPPAEQQVETARARERAPAGRERSDDAWLRALPAWLIVILALSGGIALFTML